VAKECSTCDNRDKFVAVDRPLISVYDVRCSESTEVGNNSTHLENVSGVAFVIDWKRTDVVYV
jgi:hypothetical protein